MLFNLENLISLADEVNEIRENNDEGGLLFIEADKMYSELCIAIDVLQDIDYIKKFVDDNL